MILEVGDTMKGPKTYEITIKDSHIHDGRREFTDDDNKKVSLIYL